MGVREDKLDSSASAAVDGIFRLKDESSIRLMTTATAQAYLPYILSRDDLASYFMPLFPVATLIGLLRGQSTRQQAMAYIVDRYESVPSYSEAIAAILNSPEGDVALDKALRRLLTEKTLAK